MKTGIELIAEERQRQIEVEGWTTDHDATHRDGSLAEAAASYCMSDYYDVGETPREWPSSWHQDWWKPSPNDRIRELAKAGALIAAEIDRLQAEQLKRQKA